MFLQRNNGGDMLRILALLLAFIVSPAMADDKVALTLFPERDVKAGRTIRVVAQITRGGKPLTEEELKVVHTQKFHLLVIDPTMTDYQHLHPQPTVTPGSFLFTFTPKFNGGYRAWADVTPRDTGKQQYAMADLGEPGAAAVDKKESHEATIGGYRFNLSFDQPPKAGSEAMGSIHVTDAQGQPVNSLEPVMGAYAHIVGFYEDYQTIVHTHPMGEEPKLDSERGGPELMFHLAPEKPGYVRLFAQVKIGGQELFTPFGVIIGE